MYSFSACMTSRISQFKFGVHKLKECNGAVLNRSKGINGLGPQISSSGHQGAPISSSLRSLFCPLRHQRPPQIHVPLFHQGLKFLFSTTGHLAPPPQFPHCFIKGFQFPHCAIKGTQFPHHVIKMITSNFPSRYQGVTILHCVIKGPPL